MLSFLHSPCCLNVINILEGKTKQNKETAVMKNLRDITTLTRQFNEFRSKINDQKEYFIKEMETMKKSQAEILLVKNSRMSIFNNHATRRKQVVIKDSLALPSYSSIIQMLSRHIDISELHFKNSNICLMLLFRICTIAKHLILKH